MFTKPLIFVLISVLVIAIIYNPSATFGVPNRSNDPGAECVLTGEESENGLALTECCWEETVPEGTGGHGYNNELELYCSTCEDGGTRGKINCSDPELQYVEAPPTPLGPLVLPEDGVLQQPTSPLGPRPFTPQGEATVQEPPLFGRNVENAPLGGGVLGQPLTTIAPTPPPQFGQIDPEGQIQPPTTTLGEEGGEAAAQPRAFSPTGGCIPTITTSCVPCDPGLPGANCIPSNEWPPVSITGEDIPQAQLPSEAEEEETLPRTPGERIAPETEIPELQTQDDGAAEGEGEEGQNPAEQPE